MSAPFTELKKPLELFSVLCRGCLADSGEMKNMYEWGLVEAFNEITDIQLKTWSSHSELLCQELLCTSCEEMLKACHKFRAQCQASDRALRETAQTKKLQTSQDSATSSSAIKDSQENTVLPIMFGKKAVFMILAPDTVSKIYLPCTYCREKYMKHKDLLQHLGKAHQIDINDYQIELQYYCHEKKCQYSMDSKKYFTGRKNLNQHFIKVHRSRLLQCKDCDSNFSTETELNRHAKTCTLSYICHICHTIYNTNDRLTVHLMRKHPEIHRQYKEERKSMKRKLKTVNKVDKVQKTTTSTETTVKIVRNNDAENFADYICDSPKRTSATQTKPDSNIRNDVTLPSWQKSDYYKTDEISTSTQTDIFEDLLSLKSQNSEDESSIFFSETVSLSDIQTQTFPVEFGLSTSNKETLTSETQSPDLSIKETQTCPCLCDSPKLNYNRLFESVSSSPGSANLTSTETQTADFKYNVTDVLLSFNSAETQTSFDEGSGLDKHM